MKEYRIAWIADLGDGSVLEGRSLVQAESEKEAVDSLIFEKAREYHLRPSMVKIRSVIELNEEMFSQGGA